MSHFSTSRWRDPSKTYYEQKRQQELANPLKQRTVKGLPKTGKMSQLEPEGSAGSQASATKHTSSASTPRKKEDAGYQKIPVSTIGKTRTSTTLSDNPKSNVPSITLTTTQSRNTTTTTKSGKARKSNENSSPGKKNSSGSSASDGSPSARMTHNRGRRDAIHKAVRFNTAQNN